MGKKILLLNSSSFEDHEVINWNGESLPLVSMGDKRWLIKGLSTDNYIREILFYNIAKDYCNIPPIQKIKRRNYSRIKKIGIDTDKHSDNLIATQIVNDIDEKTFIHNDINSATAFEMVFSLLFRRRDVDIWNRSYSSSGVPFFYDLSACLDYEYNLMSIDSFFEYNCYGYAGSWRVKIIDDFTVLNTNILRKMDDHYNYINNKDKFLKELDLACSIVKKIRLKRIKYKKSLSLSQFKKTSILIDMLISNQSSIDNDLEILKRIIFSNIKPNLDMPSSLRLLKKTP